MEENDGLSARIRQCIGDEPVAAFSRRCGIGESLMRKYLTGSEPSARNLARIAEVAGVTLDWLATGRGPRRRADAQPAVTIEDLAAPHTRRWQAIIELIEGIPDEAARNAAIEELFARAQNAADMAELRQAVKTLTAALQKRA